MRNLTKPLPHICNLWVILAISLATAYAADNSALPVATMRLEAAKYYTQVRQFVGRVEANRVSQVGFELDGVLSVIHKEEGDVVKRGDVVAELDTQKLRARQQEAKAGVQHAQAALRLARASVKRVQRVADKRLLSEQTLDEALEARDSAQAQLARANAALQIIEVDLAKSVLKAPFEGIVIARNHDEGDVIAAGRSVLRIQETARHEARIGIANHLADQFQLGQKVLLQINRQTVQADIKAILPLRNRTVRTVDVLFSLPNMAARPGDLVSWRLSKDVKADGFWVPLSALTEGVRGLWNLYVVDEENHRAELRAVEILYQTSEQAYVRGLIAAGERVVSAGTQRIVPQQTIRLAQRPE